MTCACTCIISSPPPPPPPHPSITCNHHITLIAWYTSFYSVDIGQVKFYWYWTQKKISVLVWVIRFHTEMEQFCVTFRRRYLNQRSSNKIVLKYRFRPDSYLRILVVMPTCFCFCSLLLVLPQPLLKAKIFFSLLSLPCCQAAGHACVKKCHKWYPKAQPQKCHKWYPKA